MLNFRAPNSPIRHLTVDSVVTLCGKDAKLGARWANADQGKADPRMWRACAKCHAAAVVVRKGIKI